VFSRLASTASVVGADSYANFFDQLLSPAEVEPLVAGYAQRLACRPPRASSVPDWPNSPDPVPSRKVGTAPTRLARIAVYV
jgi:hypothetical protein